MSDVQKLDYESFKDKMGEWAPYFRPFIEGPEMWEIFQKLKQESVVGREIILPYAPDTFKAFQTCPPSNLKAIFYLMDPYPRCYRGTKIPMATGIAMDCSNSPKGILQPSLIKFYDAMSRELTETVDYSPSLSYLQEQGIMFLNTDLTCRMGQTGSHEGLWQPFQKYFLEEVMSAFTGIVYVLCGKASHKMKKYIWGVGNYIFKLDHPAFAERLHTDWDSGGVFNTINNILKDNNKEKVIWNKKYWEVSKTLPF